MCCHTLLVPSSSVHPLLPSAPPSSAPPSPHSPPPIRLRTASFVQYNTSGVRVSSTPRGGEDVSVVVNAKYVKGGRVYAACCMLQLVSGLLSGGYVCCAECCYSTLTVAVERTTRLSLRCPMCNQTTRSYITHTYTHTPLSPSSASKKKVCDHHRSSSHGQPLHRIRPKAPLRQATAL